jgi:hypothetical protein
MVEAEGYVRTANDVGLPSTSIELTYDGDDYVVQWANNLSEYTQTGALLVAGPLTGQSFSIAGLNGLQAGKLVLLEGSSASLGEVTLDSISELNSGTPAFLDTQTSVAASNAIGLSDGGYAAAWFTDDFTLSLSSESSSPYTVALGTGDGGSTHPALAQLSDGGVVVGWTNNETSGVFAGLDDISLAIVSPLGTITNTQISGSTLLGDEPAIAALNNGDFAEFWTAFSNNALPSAVEEQIFSSTGAEVGGPTAVNTLSDLGGGAGPSATTLSNGDVVLVYLQGGPQVVAGDETLDENIIQGQVFSPNGAPIAGDAFSINTNAATDANAVEDNSPLQVSVTGPADGAFAVGWITQAGDVKTQIFTLNGTTASQSEPSSDFDGNGYSDILWQNTNGQAAIWELSQTLAPIDGTSQIPGGSELVSTNPGPSWQEIGTGDFNDDGHSDILWQNTNGQVGIWEMNGTNVISAATVGPNPGPSWKAIGTGDFNGDGFSDILWQNASGQAAIWEMNGTNLISAATVGTNPGPSWQEIGTGDFNGAGYSDILWQNADGQAAIWEMNGANAISEADVGGNPGPSWKLIGTGDFNGDGYSDLLWQNTNGQVAIWEMNGTNVISEADVGANPGPSWKVIGTGDFNGDGYSDILFQNTNGQAAIWEMNGTNVISEADVGANPGPSWLAVKT